ncbi:MAG: RimK family alpha-L-glutamate ligase [Clostridia bacterium]|nr:RimK family alpha-L-glutamate ligase [Clostridia bacterium]
MKALILINAYANMHAVNSQVRRLREELERQGIEVDIRRNGTLSAAVTEDGQSRIAVDDYAFCIYLDKDTYAAQMMEQQGLRLFNSNDSIQVCDDKMETFLRLANRGIPMPHTLPAPLCYYPDTPIQQEWLDTVADRLGLPLIIKECNGSLGAQVYLVSTRDELYATAARLQGKKHLYQRFIASSTGQDLRVIVVGGRVVAAMKRVSDADFRSNIELGGHGEIIDLPAEAARISESAATALGLDYCGVDLLYGEKGFLLCEVNSNAFFEGVEATTRINVAAAYVQHILASI